MAKKSLAAEMSVATVESNPGMGLPVGFGGGVDDATPCVDVYAPYVSFVSTKGKLYGEVVQRIRDLQDGDPVLIRGGHYPPIKLNPFRCHYIRGFKHYSVLDGEGRIVKTCLSEESAKASGEAFKEHIEAMLLVRLDGGGVCPAMCTFKVARTGAAKRSVRRA